MGRYVLDLGTIDASQVALVGGKAAGLGALSRIDGIEVPAGFCVTVDAFQLALSAAPAVRTEIDRLSVLGADDAAAIGAGSRRVRAGIERLEVPAEVADEIARAIVRHGETDAYAVRSSATTEDRAAASAAGQHDSFLDVVGPDAIVVHVRRCWASLFTERAVTDRLRHGVNPATPGMAVVVHRLVAADAAGVLFTADPVTSNRRVASIEACAGRGDALVSGLVDPDGWTVRDGEIVDRVRRQDRPTLTDAQVVRLARLGRRIEAERGRPQDIEWCLAGDRFAVVQSRPITTLYPIPAASDGGNHVFVSVGHGQMMTDAMRPLGLSMWQMLALIPMHEAGSRLFVDVTARLASPATRAATLRTLGQADPLVGDALTQIVDRSGFIRALAEDGPGGTGGAAAGSTAPGNPAPPPTPPPPIESDPAIPAELIRRSVVAIAATQQAIAGRHGTALLRFIRDDIVRLQASLRDPLSHRALMAGMEASWWLDDHLREWLGEPNAADTLSRSAPGNVTSEMGRELLEVADVIRAHPAVVAFLESGPGDDLLDALPALDGGAQARAAIGGYLERYGMRCPGEIDITRPRWSERPSALVPLILSHAKNLPPGAAQRQFETGRREAEASRRELLERLRALPDGDAKAAETERMIDRLRAFIGYREYPKYAIVSRWQLYRRALLGEAERLVHAGLLADPEDLFFLRFEELDAVIDGVAPDPELIERRRATFHADEALDPPRVITSEGEVIIGTHDRRGVPPSALVGVAVSGGTVEGRARVVRDLADAPAALRPGDILVTRHTDPGWAPQFVTVAGLVTEVGGRMTHGAVIAREYGLPAVVGVPGATALIADGQTIRVDGTRGYVETVP